VTYIAPHTTRTVPNYPTHARWGRISAVAVAVALGAGVYTLLGVPLLALVGAAAAGVTTFVGAIYPDIDHHKSIPRRKAVRGFRILGALAVGGIAAANWEAVLGLGESLSAGVAVPPLVAGLALTALAALVVAALVNPVIGLVTRQHRGWTHSPAINLLLVGALVAGVWAVTAGRAPPARLVAVGVAGSFYFGTLVHLWLDGEVV
jgi:hypothetical protein